MYPNALEVSTPKHRKVPIVIDSAEATILRALRKRGLISRTEIANIMGWSKAKTSQEIRSLVDKGYLVETGEGASQGGRKPRLFRINNGLGYVVGIDIGATSLELGLAEVGGQILQRRGEPADVPQSTYKTRQLPGPERFAVTLENLQY